MQNPFSIYEGISGSIVSFIIQNSSGTIETIPATDCVDSVCRYQKHALHLYVSLRVAIILSVSQQQIGLAQDPLQNQSLSVSVDICTYIVT